MGLKRTDEAYVWEVRVPTNDIKMVNRFEAHGIFDGTCSDCKLLPLLLLLLLLRLPATSTAITTTATNKDDYYYFYRRNPTLPRNGRKEFTSAVYITTGAIVNCRVGHVAIWRLS